MKKELKRKILIKSIKILFETTQQNLGGGIFHVLFYHKSKIVNFSNKLAYGLAKPESKFVMDMMFGISRGQSVLLSDISRALDENINLRYTIDKLSHDLEHFDAHDIYT